MQISKSNWNLHTFGAEQSSFVSHELNELPVEQILFTPPPTAWTHFMFFLQSLASLHGEPTAPVAQLPLRIPLSQMPLLHSLSSSHSSPGSPEAQKFPVGPSAQKP